MSSLSTLPKGDSAWLLRKAIERIMEQVSVLETNIGVSTSGNSLDTQVIFNDAGTLRGDAGLTYNKTLDGLTVAGLVTASSGTLANFLTVATNVLVANAAGYLGKVGIGTATPASGYSLDVTGAAVGGIRASANNYPSLTVDSANSNGVIIYFQEGGVTQARIGHLTGVTGLEFSGNNGAFATNVHYGIDATGISTWKNVGGVAGTAMTLNATSNLVLRGGTAGATGVGLTFPATQVASSDANCLDDYEEAAFTPTIVGATTAGAGVYTTNSGRYTKIGNLVTFQVFIDWTAHTGTGNMRIGNLPFTNGSNFWAGCIGYANGIALTAGYVMTGYVESGQAFVTLQQYPTGGGGTTGIPMDTAGAIMFSGSYTV